LQSVLADRLVRSRRDEPEAARSYDRCDDRYLSIRELATRIPHAEKTIRNLMAMGQLVEGIHWFKRRGRAMFLWPAMRKWVEQRGDPAPETIPLVRS
jgi:hypothetical protein